MSKSFADIHRELIEAIKADWLAEYDRLAPKARADLSAVQERLLAAREILEHLSSQAEDSIAEVGSTLDDIRSVRKTAENWSDEDWLPDDDYGVISPDSVLPDYVSDETKELLRLMESIGSPRTCANPECGKRFFESPWGRDKLYCSDYCRVKAFRARRKAEEQGPDPSSEDPGGQSE